jgi:hypothetical protein
LRAVDRKPAGGISGSTRREPGLDLGKTVIERSRISSRVYNLAADMGGMGFIENNKALCMLSVLISTHLLGRAQACRGFYSSSACVYNAEQQKTPGIVRAKLTLIPACLKMVTDGKNF